MTITGPQPVAPELLLARARDIVPALRESAAEAERLRRLPPETLATLEAAGMWGAMRPTEAGGSAIDLGTFVHITRMLARGDASAGWIGAFFMSHGWVLSKLSAAAQADIFARRTWSLAAAAAAPPGRAEAVDGGYRLTGRWRFASGVMHASWVLLTGMCDGRMLTFTLPIGDVVVHDTWDVPGMKGTGSNDVAADGVFVPGHHAVGMETLSDADCPGAALSDYALLRYPMPRVLLLIHPAIALGVADAALELFEATAPGRIRQHTRRSIVEEPIIQSAYGRARHLVRSASLLLADAVALTDASWGGGDGAPVDLERRAELNLAISGAGVAAFEAVDIIVRHSGASIHRTGNPLDRICRDTQVMRNHAALDWDYFTTLAGRVMLNQGLGDHPEVMF
jgi:3-hydroxy-9,10-secoandrosta-1,3,5(10)-triene-9,17-dione monooxygenase